MGQQTQSWRIVWRSRLSKVRVIRLEGLLGDLSSAGKGGVRQSFLTSSGDRKQTGIIIYDKKMMGPLTQAASCRSQPP